MRRLLLILAAVLALGACAPDDQVFDISALSKRHQRIFAEAAADLNERYERAQFEIGDGASFAGYTDACATLSSCDAQAHTRSPFHPEHLHQGWMILFGKQWAARTSDADLFQTSAHELCHVLGFGHDEKNPQGGSC